MIKVITTLKKKAGLSTEDFRAYYETHHRLIGEKYLAGYATRYVRRYLEPMAGADGLGCAFDQHYPNRNHLC